MTRGAAHRGSQGRYIEALVRTLLNRHLPANLRAVSGFILCPATKTDIQDVARVTEFTDRHSSRLDIIVYDMDDYPVYERFEEFCIVPPEGVIGFGTIKDWMGRSHFKTRRLKNVGTEIGLHILAYDIKRAKPLSPSRD